MPGISFLPMRWLADVSTGLLTCFRRRIPSGSGPCGKPQLPGGALRKWPQGLPRCCCYFWGCCCCRCCPDSRPAPLAVPPPAAATAPQWSAAPYGCVSYHRASPQGRRWALCGTGGSWVGVVGYKCPPQWRRLCEHQRGGGRSLGCRGRHVGWIGLSTGVGHAPQ